MPEIVHLAAQRVPRTRKAGALDARREVFVERAQTLNTLLMEGVLTVGEWLEKMKVEVKGLHISAYVSGLSGYWEDMTFSDWGHIGAELRHRQYPALRRWADQLRADPDFFSLAQMAARARLYAASATASFERGVVREVGLDPSLFPAMPAEGTLCKANCKCRWAVRILSKARGDYDISWRLGSAEHCRTCRRRAVAWKRLRVRGGQIIDTVEIVWDN